MSVLSQQNSCATATAGNADASSDWGNGNNVKSRSLRTTGKNKIFEIRRQLIEGSYDIDGRLSIAIDRLFKDLAI